MNAEPETMEHLAKRLEAFETPAWAVDAILDVELMTDLVIDPCCGRGALSIPASQRGYNVVASDIHDWGHPRFSTEHDIREGYPTLIMRNWDFLTGEEGLKSGDVGDVTYFMNPPFSKAEAFIEKAHEKGARKIVCFQRFSWWEAMKRKEFWAQYPPNRIYICGNRASCWRFDIPEDERKSSTTTAHAWFVWERGHPQGTALGHIYKDGSNADSSTG